jgi:hypothetical protein
MNSRFDWPDDADGDVLRRLKRSGFDFSATWNIDFNIDLDSWPPPEALIKELSQRFERVGVIEPDQPGNGYIAFVVNSKLTYELVISVQRVASEIAKPFGGVCESWGVLH